MPRFCFSAGLVLPALLATVVAAAPAVAHNIARNAGFELGTLFAGTPMRQGDEYYQMHAKSGDRLRWMPLDAEGWWADGPETSGIEVSEGAAHSGKAGLRVRAESGQSRAVVSSLNRQVPAGPVTLSAWIKTAGCQGALELRLLTGWQQAMSRGMVRQGRLPLPADSDWTRVQVTVESPSALQAILRLQVDAGVVCLDDVQIEAGAAPSPFNVRPEEWLRLRLAGTEETRLPIWIAGDTARRVVSVTNESRLPVRGTARLFLGPWNAPKQRQLAEFDAGALAPGASRTVTFTTGDLPPDAYVLCLSLEGEGETLFTAESLLATERPLGGVSSNGMLLSRAATRFVVAPRYQPARLFGVGNSMLDTCGGWFPGRPLAGYAEARPLGLTGVRAGAGEEHTYLAAAAGTPIHVMAMRADFGAPAGAPFANPVKAGAVDVFHPEGLAFFTRRAGEIGRAFAANPMIASFQMSNESPYPNGGALCPSPWADAAFREWCRKRYGTLDALNARWRTHYTRWEEVEQIASARFAEEERNRPRKEGAAAVDWTASTGTFSPQVMQRMKENPGRAMDWLRWRTHTSLWMYSTFRDEARKHDKKTLYGTNLCWPAFWPQMFLPFSRVMDNVQLDIQYTSGLQRALGSPHEMMDGMEMAESAASGKPIWGIEVYVQPQWPGAFPALQNWGLLAHGMTNNLVFAWKPYSDHGPVKGTRAWEKPDAKPMWFLIDNDGTRLPAYESYVRSLEEIRAYHRKHDGFAVRRVPSPVAFYVSPDTAEYVLLETGNKPWLSCWQRTRNTLIYLLRMNGVAVEYVDDTSLPQAPGRYRFVVVPAAYALSQDAASRLAAFARAGGTVVLAGPSGLVDPWLNAYANVGGPAWADLGWHAPKFAATPARVSFAGGTDAAPESKEFRGADYGAMPGATPLKDGRGTPIGWERAWGRGRLIAYGILPDLYGSDPHIPVDLGAWIRQVLERSGLPLTGRWVSRQADTVPGKVGEGSAVVEVVVRQKGDGERFVFCLNQGGAGEGTVEVTVGDGAWRAEDVIAGQSLPEGACAGGIWRCPMRLDALGYRVIRLVRQR